LHLQTALANWTQAGADILAQGKANTERAASASASLFTVSATQFLTQTALQTEAFGPACLVVRCKDTDQLVAVAKAMQANLTATLCSAQDDRDDALASALALVLRPKVGRLLNDKMPTGVAVCPAMMHGGPYPVSAHAGFTAVGLPAAIKRFAYWQSYDNVRASRLPIELSDHDAPAELVRTIDGIVRTGSC
jgi:2,5-dioxopentanoate dehydrogenase